MLHLEDYCIEYPGGKKLFYGDIRAPKGKLTGLFGKSGCGKTSLLESLINPRFPGKVTCRSALLGGEPLPPPGPELFRQVSYCPQFAQAALNPRLTVRGHLRLTFRGNGLREDPDRTQQLMDRLRLGSELLYRRPGALSGGEQQRMVLLLCAVKNPRLLILDEPSSAVDLITLKEIADFLEQLRGETTMLLVSHSHPFLTRIADHIIELGGATC